MRYSRTHNLHSTRRRHHPRRCAGLAPALAAWVLGAVLAACTPANDAPPVEEPPLPTADTLREPVPSTVPGAERPEVVEGTIALEGMEEPTTYRLYRTPEGFPVPFSTYVPEEMVAETVSSGEGDAVRFYANFGGVRNDSAFVSIVFPRAGATRAEVEEAARAAAAGAAEPVEGSAWALESFRGLGVDAVRRVSVGEHGGRYFYVLTRYPAEMGDGMGPRIARILEEWEWADTGGGLGG